MREVNFVVFSNHLAEIRDFFLAHFPAVQQIETEERLVLRLMADCGLMLVDAAKANHAPTSTARVLWALALNDMEHERFISKGVPVTDLITEDWGPTMGGNVRSFLINLPGGLELQIYQAHVGEKRQLMTTGDGTDTRKAHGG